MFSFSLGFILGCVIITLLLMFFFPNKSKTYQRAYALSETRQRNKTVVGLEMEKQHHSPLGSFTQQQLVDVVAVKRS